MVAGIPKIGTKAYEKALTVYEESSSSKRRAFRKPFDPAWGRPHAEPSIVMSPILGILSAATIITEFALGRANRV